MAQLWKGVQKSALHGTQACMDENDDRQDQSHLDSPSQRTNALSGTLEPVLDDLVLLDRKPDEFHLKPPEPDADCKTVCDHIHDLLPLDNLQRLVVEEIMDYIIKNKGKMRLDTGKQLLLYVRGEGGVGKSWVIKALEMGFALLDRRKE